MFAELLRQRLAPLSDISTSKINELEKHYELLKRWNRVVNLTAITSLEEIIKRHYCESVFLAVHVPEGRLRIADIGAGAGFPGIPIAIVRPECSIALIESDQRKGVFLREATRGLNNVRVIVRRAEEVEERFDWAVSRGVQWAKIEKVVIRLAEHVGLLAGGQAPPTTCFTWNKPIRLPWGERRYLWLGHSIPRETR